VLNRILSIVMTIGLLVACADEGRELQTILIDSIDMGRSDVGPDGGIGSDGAVPAVGLATPDYCGSCHQQHFEQWRTSMHANSVQDPIFRALNKKGIEETEGRLDQFCVQCHAPNASLRGLLPVVERNGRFEMPLDLSNPLIGQGVQCTSCHSMAMVEATQNAKIVLSDTTYYGASASEAATRAHPIEPAPLFSDPLQKNIMCGSCHDFVNPNGVRLDSTFSTWYSNAYNDVRNPERHRTCQDCHMPTYEGPITKDGETRTLHSHHFLGVYQALQPGFPGQERQAQIARDLLSDCAILDVRYNGIDELGNAVIIVSVENINNGHQLPAGSTADTQVWVHLQIFDEADNLVFESGMTDANGDLMDGVMGHSLDPDGDPELMLFGQFIYGQDGGHVNFPWQAHSFTDNLIGPGQRKWRDFPVPALQISTNQFRVLATLNYRTFPPFLIRDLVDGGYLDPQEISPIPTIEMERTEALFRLR